MLTKFISKNQLIGIGVGIVAVVGVSVYTGKIDINNLTGKAEPVMASRLPPPVKDASADVDALLANANAGSENDAFLDELTSAPVVDQSVEQAPMEIVPSATLAATNPQSVVNAPVFAPTQIIKADALPPVVESSSAPGAVTGSAPDVPATAQVTPATLETAGVVAQAAISTLPENATGQDLIRLQTKLAFIEKQKALAAGEEAIAESRLKAAKAQYELAQIGQPSPQEIAAERQAREAAVAVAAVNTSVLDSVRVLSTSRANGSSFATILFNGKLVDVKKGSFIAGYLIDQVTDNHVKFVGEKESKTVWIN